jgi:hypothetical protein
MKIGDTVEVVSGQQTTEQILQEVSDVSGLFVREGFRHLMVECGWGCKWDSDQLWKANFVDANDLPTFVGALINDGIFTPGKADLFIRDEDQRLTLKFCHESDIHLSTNSGPILEHIVSSWLRKGYGGFERVGENWLPLSLGQVQ